MKNFIFIAAFIIILVSCGSYRSLDLRKLTTGMTKAQVEQIAGLPNRVLSINETEDGYQEILEYQTSRNEVYALEFWNDYLTGYEYLYDDIEYIAPLYPPSTYPPYGRPIIVLPPDNNRPNRPNRPNQPNRPNRPNRPGNPGGSTRPPATNQRPTTRPTEGSRPVGTPPANNPSRTREQQNSQTSPQTRPNRIAPDSI